MEAALDIDLERVSSIVSVEGEIITVFCEVIETGQKATFRVSPEEKVETSVLSGMPFLDRFFLEAIYFGGEAVLPESTWEDIDAEDGAKIEIREIQPEKQVRGVDKYEGQLSESSMPHGRGRMYYGGIYDGNWYEGQFKSGKKHGHGKFVWGDAETLALGRNGAWYEGQWVANCKEGDGIYSFPDDDGRCYEGQWLNNQYNGHGKFTWGQGLERFDLPRGTWYEGPFQDNLLNGTGTHTYADGRVFEAEWSYDQLISERPLGVQE